MPTRVCLRRFEFCRPSTSEPLGTTHFEGARGHVAAAAEPHLLHQVCVGLGDLAPHSQGVLSVDLRLVLVVEEVLGERRGVAQALKSREQKAASGKINENHHS